MLQYCLNVLWPKYIKKIFWHSKSFAKQYCSNIANFLVKKHILGKLQHYWQSFCQFPSFFEKFDEFYGNIAAILTEFLSISLIFQKIWSILRQYLYIFFPFPSFFKNLTNIVIILQHYYNSIDRAFIDLKILSNIAAVLIVLVFFNFFWFRKIWIILLKYFRNILMFEW